MMLISASERIIEAGCDEAGRGCLAGPVFAAAVILPPDFFHPQINDSKKLNEKMRYSLRAVIEKEALSYSVRSVSENEIDRLNILQASIRAMHLALDHLDLRPEKLLIDGNYFTPYRSIPYKCIVKGDGKYASIAAAGILAKTYRDDYMKSLAERFPQYGWEQNKGYATLAHRIALLKEGPSIHHRKSFTVHNQLNLFK